MFRSLMHNDEISFKLTYFCNGRFSGDSATSGDVATWFAE